MKLFFNELKNFITATFRDPRIPDRDKKMFLALLSVLALRILFIPDWIPYFGVLDVLILTGILCDYICHVLDQNLLLSHYPWGMKSFARIRRIAGFFAYFAPFFISDNLWLYTKDPF